MFLHLRKELVDPTLTPPGLEEEEEEEENELKDEDADKDARAAVLAGTRLSVIS